jgi:hypothetical protein
LLSLNSTQAAIANAYGRVGEFTIDSIPEPTEEERKNKEAVFYRFETPIDDDSQTLIYLQEYPVENSDSKTTVISARGVLSGTVCKSPKRSIFTTETSSDLRIDQGDGTNSSLLWSGPRDQSLTTWAAYSGTDCGPRCTNVMALVPISDINSTHQIYHFYDCNCTVHEIKAYTQQANETFHNAPEYQIPDQVAQTFAGAIGSEKRYSGNDPFLYSQHPDSFNFAHMAPDVSLEDLETRVSAFSAFSIGAMDANGANAVVNGYPPRALQTLKVDWKWVILILAGLPAVQLLMVIIITLLSARAVIKDTSFIAAAQLLKPALDDLGSQGSILTGDEIADHLGNVKLCYGVRKIGGTGEYFVDAIKQAERIEHRQGTVWWPGRKMPQGLYDGPDTRQGDGHSRSSSGW